LRPWGQFPLVGVGAVDGGQGQLVQIVLRIDALGSDADTGDRGDQEAEQYQQHGQEHKQLHHREATLPPLPPSSYASNVCFSKERAVRRETSHQSSPSTSPPAGVQA